MKSVRPYLQEDKDEIITRFRQSGLSQTQFCNLSEVPITNSTLSEWLRKAGYDKFGISFGKKQEPAQSDLNIVCYNIGENSRHEVKGGNGQEPTLQEMIGFQQDVYNLCSRLYRLPCSKGSIGLLCRIKGVL